MDQHERLHLRYEHFRSRLARKWNGDPTVLASFCADFERLLAQVEEGRLRGAHAQAMLTKLYYEHLPENDPRASRDTHVADESARPVPGHGQFYRRIGPRIWLALDYAESNAC